MTHFAKIENNKVVNVIVAEKSYIDTLDGEWIQTSYNTNGGKNKRTGIPIRKNYAGIDDVYDSVRNAFYHQKPYNSWILNEENCIWDSPIPKPIDDKFYQWNEKLQTWNIIID